MKKIMDVTNSPAVTGPRKIQPSKNNLFQQKLNEVQAKNRPQDTVPVADPKLGEVQPTSFPIIANPSTGIVNQTGKLLDLLEDYANQMGDPKKTLRDIEPLIATIQKNATELVEAADESPGELKELAAEAAIAANVEYAKFYRGDYN